MSTATSFQELMSSEGLQVVPCTKVPSDYTVRKVEVEFPDHWIPTKQYMCDLEKANLLRDKFQDEALYFGVFDQVEKSKRNFVQADCHMFGGKAFLQPGKFDAGRNLIHKFTIIFCLWDDLMEKDDEDPGFGKASVHRLRRILASRSENAIEGISQAVSDIANEDVRDKSLMMWWEDFFCDVAKASAEDASRRGASKKGAKTFYQRLKDSFMVVLDGLDGELEYLSSVKASENIDLNNLWQIRINSVGCPVVYDLIIHATQFDPEDALYDSLWEIKRMYATIVRAFNEVASIPKDIADELGSLLTSTMMVHKCSFDATLEKLLEKVHDSIQAFDTIAATTLALVSEHEYEALNDFLYAVRYSALGFAEWHLPDANWMGSGLRYCKVKLLRPRDDIFYDFGVSFYSCFQKAVKEPSFVGLGSRPKTQKFASSA